MSLDIIERKRIDFISFEDRFSTKQQDARSVPLDQASPPPPEEVPRSRVSGRVIPVPTLMPGTVVRTTQKKRAVHDPLGVANPKRVRVRVRSVHDPVKAKTNWSPVAIAACEKDGGFHVWGPHAKKQWKCIKCKRSVYKNRVPGHENITVIRRPRIGRADLPACTDPRGHKMPLAYDGFNSSRKHRVRCSRCEQTRNATDAEIAAVEAKRAKRVGDK